MTAVEEVTVELLENLFAEDLPCWVRDCDEVAVWELTWSCGCLITLCPEHRNGYTYASVLGKGVDCSRHGLENVWIVRSRML